MVQVGVADLHLVAHLRQAQADVGGHLPLQLDALPTGPLHPGSVQALLGVHVVIHRVHHHLHVALGLHEGPHHAERTHRRPFLHQEARG